MIPGPATQPPEIGSPTNRLISELIVLEPAFRRGAGLPAGNVGFRADVYVWQNPIRQPPQSPPNLSHSPSSDNQRGEHVSQNDTPDVSRNPAADCPGTPVPRPRD